MAVTRPLQRTFYVLLISLAIILYLNSTINNKIPLRLSFLSKNVSITYNSTDYDDFLNMFNKNKSFFEKISWQEILKSLEFSHTSIDLNNTTKKSSSKSISREYIHILGLFELTTKLGRRQEGESELMAAKMAVKHVNALNIIQGYEVVLLVNDTKCDPGVGIDRFFHAIYSKKIILMLLGAGCSNVSEALAHIVPYWNIIQVSYGSKSPALSDRRKFPLFFRTVAPDSSHNLAKIYFVRQFKWHVVATFSQNENAYLFPVNHLIAELEKANVSCILTVTFSVKTYKEQLKLLKSLDIRIIIGSFSATMAPKIFCTIYELNMYGSEYVWILEDHQETWWSHDSVCSPSNLRKAVEGLFLTGDYEYDPQNEEFFKIMKNQKTHTTGISKFIKQTYDAVWTMSLTLRKNRVDELKNFHYNRDDMAGSFYETMENLKFVGVSGPIRFNGADRIGDLVVSQIQDGVQTHVALYDSTENILNFNCILCKTIKWDNNQVPIAQRILKERLITIPNSVFVAITTSSSFGVAASVGFLYFNLRFRRMKPVKLSSPNLNNLAVAGCVLVYLSVILFGISNVSIEVKDYFKEICSARIYLLSAGFSLTFGSIFAKSYRVHRLFTYSVTGPIKDKLLRDRQLIGLILIPLFVDSLIMALWIHLDPLERHLHDLIVEINFEDPKVVYQPQVELCHCHNTIGWHIALFGYKTIILLMGAYMAWKTRHVSVPNLNDSQYIGICVYSAVFSTIIVIVFSFVTEYFILSYLAKTLSILVSTTITLVLMFLPKLKSVFGKVDTELSIMRSMGLKIECNTRRFILDDPREVLCRLEIQNNVYRCQLEALERDILHLEEILRLSEPSSNISSGNIYQISHDIHLLNVPSMYASRASWPTWQNQTIKPFCSENKLNSVRDLEKTNLFGKLKRFFGSFASLGHSYNNLKEKSRNEWVKVGSEKPRSNPEIFEHILTPFNKDVGKIKSENYIGNK